MSSTNSNRRGDGQTGATVTGYRLPDELTSWVRIQAAKEKRYPAHLVAEALRAYRDKIEGNERAKEH